MINCHHLAMLIRMFGDFFRSPSGDPDAWAETRQDLSFELIRANFQTELELYEAMPWRWNQKDSTKKMYKCRELFGIPLQISRFDMFWLRQFEMFRHLASNMKIEVREFRDCLAKTRNYRFLYVLIGIYWAIQPTTWDSGMSRGVWPHMAS